MAFAPYEVRPLLGAVALLRGITIQLAYRWSTGQVVADPSDRAVLLWSAASREGWRGSIHRQLLGVVAATSAGMALAIVGNAILLPPMGLMLWAAGADAKVVIGAGLAVVGAPLLATGWRALRAYQSDTALTHRLPSPSTTRWRIDYLAAVPARSGHGGRLLKEFLGRADESDVEVVLHCESRNVAFYRRHGFHLVDAEVLARQHLMLRPARSVRLRVRHDGELVHHSRTRRSGQTGRPLKGTHRVASLNLTVIHKRHDIDGV
jgi:hypothetical protein